MEKLIYRLTKWSFLFMVLGLLLDIIFLTSLGLLIIFIDIILYIQLLFKFRQ